MVLQTETSLDIRRVLDTLPHRYPFLMIDRVIEMKGDGLSALKNVTINEPFFQGHYPGNPVLPGVLQIEAMAQAAGILMLRKISTEGKTALFMSCDKVKFRRAVRPGDQLLINVKMTKTRGNKIGVAEGECVASADAPEPSPPVSASAPNPSTRTRTEAIAALISARRCSGSRSSFGRSIRRRGPSGRDGVASRLGPSLWAPLRLRRRRGGR